MAELTSVEPVLSRKNAVINDLIYAAYQQQEEIEGIRSTCIKLGQNGCTAADREQILARSKEELP